LFQRARLLPMPSTILVRFSFQKSSNALAMENAVLGVPR
jgi:hypothetical protein